MFELVWILHIYIADEQGLVMQVDAHEMILAFASDGGKKRRRLISAHADGGPRSRVFIR